MRFTHLKNAFFSGPEGVGDQPFVINKTNKSINYNKT